MKYLSYLLLWSLSATAAHASLIAVTLDTSALIGGQYSLVFDLIDGDATLNNTATVSGARFGGGSLVGVPALTGGASGSLAATAILADTSFFNEYLQELTPGSFLSFVLNATTNFAGGTPDSLTFLLIDNTTGLPVPTVAPLGTDVFLALDLDSTSPALQTFGSDVSRTTVSIAAPVVVAQVPEPRSLELLVTVGLFMVGGYFARRKSHHAR